MKPLLKTQFTMRDGSVGQILTRKRVDGTYITTYEPQMGLSFHSIDSNRENSHNTVKSFLRDVKGCTIEGDAPKIDPPIKPKKFVV